MGHDAKVGTGGLHQRVMPRAQKRQCCASVSAVADELYMVADKISARYREKTGRIKYDYIMVRHICGHYII